MERIRATGRRVLLFTNGTGHPPPQYAADIRSLGFTLADEEFMNPAVVAARWIARRHPGKSVLVLGGPGVGDDLGLEIAMARRAGARAALVLTGVSSAADAATCPAARRPDAVLEDATALLA